MATRVQRLLEELNMNIRFGELCGILGNTGENDCYVYIRGRWLRTRIVHNSLLLVYWGKVIKDGQQITIRPQMQQQNT